MYNTMDGVADAESVCRKQTPSGAIVVKPIMNVDVMGVLDA